MQQAEGVQYHPILPSYWMPCVQQGPAKIPQVQTRQTCMPSPLLLGAGLSSVSYHPDFTSCLDFKAG